MFGSSRNKIEQILSSRIFTNFCVNLRYIPRNIFVRRLLFDLIVLFGVVECVVVWRRRRRFMCVRWCCLHK